jgi:Phage integrase, N-terminal SAM-like domain
VLKPGKGQRSFALRVWAYGKREYITLGRPEDGWTLRQAERELAVVLRDIDLGVWKPSRPEPARAENDPLFHEFASEWFAAKQPELAPNTARSYRNDLTKHLLPFFAERSTSLIVICEVDRYRQEKVHEAARLTAAAEEGKTRTVVVVDPRPTRRRRPRARPPQSSPRQRIGFLIRRLTGQNRRGYRVLWSPAQRVSRDMSQNVHKKRPKQPLASTAPRRSSNPNAAGGPSGAGVIRWQRTEPRAAEPRAITPLSRETEPEDHRAAVRRAAEPRDRGPSRGGQASR